MGKQGRARKRTGAADWSDDDIVTVLGQHYAAFGFGLTMLPRPTWVALQWEATKRGLDERVSEAIRTAHDEIMAEARLGQHNPPAMQA